MPEKKQDLPPVMPPEIAARGPLQMPMTDTDPAETPGLTYKGAVKRAAILPTPPPEPKAKPGKVVKKFIVVPKPGKAGRPVSPAKAAKKEFIASVNNAFAVEVTVKAVVVNGDTTWTTSKKIWHEVDRINPHAGLTREQVLEVHNKHYEDAPAYDNHLGDMTPDFIAWLLENHPADYAVRYHGRIVGGRIL